MVSSHTAHHAVLLIVLSCSHAVLLIPHFAYPAFCSTRTLLIGNTGDRTISLIALRTQLIKPLHIVQHFSSRNLAIWCMDSVQLSIIQQESALQLHRGDGVACSAHNRVMWWSFSGGFRI